MWYNLSSLSLASYCWQGHFSSFSLTKSLSSVMMWVDDVYLDFQKAFDKVAHQRLLLKLKAHCIGNGAINWIEKWLTRRRQRVIVDGGNWKTV